MDRIPKELIDDLKKVGKGLGLWQTDAELESWVEAMSDEQIAALKKFYAEFHDAINGIEQEFQAAKHGLAEIYAKAFAKLKYPSRSRMLRSIQEDAP